VITRVPLSQMFTNSVTLAITRPSVPDGPLMDPMSRRQSVIFTRVPLSQMFTNSVTLAITRPSVPDGPVGGPNVQEPILFYPLPPPLSSHRKL
jgi:hypothetical protein